MIAWVREEDEASKNRKRKRGVGESDKVEVALRVIVGSLRRFEATLIKLAQRFPKRSRLHR